jgi:hypothetical protein
MPKISLKTNKDDKLVELQKTIDDQCQDYHRLVEILTTQFDWHTQTTILADPEKIASLFRSTEDAIRWGESLGLLTNDVKKILDGAEPDSKGRKAVNFVKNIQEYLRNII